MVKRGDHDDMLHVMVHRVTGKSSISKLSQAEAARVMKELDDLAIAENERIDCSKPHHHEERPGGITADQQRKAWKLVYELVALDEIPSIATPAERLCGAIKRTLQVDSMPVDPFRFVTLQGGWQLIEALKKILEHRQRKIGR
jgi:hypothetical protein